MAKRSKKFRVTPIWGAYAFMALIAAALLLGQNLAILQLENRAVHARFSETVMKANQDLYRETAVEATSGRQFMPSYRLVFPANDDIRLNYWRYSDSTLYVTDVRSRDSAASGVRAAGTPEKAFVEINKLQRCSRTIQVSLNKPETSLDGVQLKLVTTKTLKDGRVAYIYETSCPYDIRVLDLVKQMESY